MNRLSPPHPGTSSSTALANLVVVLPLVWAAVLQARSPTAYAGGVQEDGVLEWMTVWGFVLAAGLFGKAAHREYLERRALPWFSLGLSLFCILVALEEVSWGQRLLGYRPPVYFLEHNFQQELNVHNLVDTSLRKLTLKTIIVGYGVALPLFTLANPTRGFLARLGIWSPPLALIPAFAAAAFAYEIYPWKYTGELVELMLGIAFPFAALAGLQTNSPPRSYLPRWTTLMVSTLVIATLGSVSGSLSARAHLGHPGNIEAALAETESLKQDLESLAEDNNGEPATDCGLHRRVYTWVTRSNVAHLFEGRFAALRLQGLPDERADYFLDPWNSPYWVRHRCSSKIERVFVYSFGPNRKRDSGPWEIRGDDLGAMIEIEPSTASED